MAQPGSQAGERINLVRHGRGSTRRPELSGAEARAAEDRLLWSRSVNGQFGMRPQGREDYEARRGRFSRRFLIEVEGTGPIRPSLVPGR
jgi:hypothetical protein